MLKHPTLSSRRDELDPDFLPSPAFSRFRPRTLPHAPPVSPPPPSCCSGLPHAAFWGDFNELVVDGLLFAFSRFRKPARGARKGGLATMGNATPDSAPLYGGSSGSAGADGDVSSKAVAFGEL